MLCSSCNNTVNPGKFCTKCGTKAPQVESSRRCSNCNQQLSPGTKFCTNCGSPVSSQGNLSKKYCNNCNIAILSKFCTQCGNARLDSTPPNNTINNSSQPSPKVQQSSPMVLHNTTNTANSPNTGINNIKNTSGQKQGTTTSGGIVATPTVNFPVQLKSTATFIGKPCAQCGTPLETKFCQSCSYNNEDINSNAESEKKHPQIPQIPQSPPSPQIPQIPRGVVGGKLPPPKLSLPPQPPPTHLVSSQLNTGSNTATNVGRSAPNNTRVAATKSVHPLPPNPRPSNAILANCPNCGSSRQTKACTNCGWAPEKTSSQTINIQPNPSINSLTMSSPGNMGLHSSKESDLNVASNWKSRSASLREIPRINVYNEHDVEPTETQDDQQLEMKRRTQLLNSEPTRRSWKKKYDTLKKDQRFTGIPSVDPSSSPIGGSIKSRERAHTYNNLDPQLRVIREIIDTEEDYTKDLHIIIDIFLKPMRKDEIATTQEIAAIFSNVELIVGVNEQLLQAFKKDETTRGIAQAFISLAEFLKMYSGFCSNQAQSFDVINKLKEKKDKKFETFLQYCFARPEAQGLDFNAYMIKPVQRICKYPLLLRELINKTDPNSSDYPLLQEAFNKIESIVNTVNEKKRESEEALKIIDIAHKIQAPENLEIVSPTRRYIKEGELMHYAANGRLKSGYFFLFNDLFVYTKKKGTKYSFKFYAPLDVTLLRYVSTYEKPAFEMVCPTTYKAWPFAFETEEEKLRFIEELQELIDKTTEHLQTISRRNSSTTIPTYQVNNMGGSSPGTVVYERRISQLNKPVPQLPDVVIFDCTYYDNRRVVIPRQTLLSYEAFYQKILETFQVDGVTVMWEDRFVDSTEELYYLLSDGANYYQLMLYDPY